MSRRDIVMIHLVDVDVLIPCIQYSDGINRVVQVHLAAAFLSSVFERLHNIACRDRRELLMMVNCNWKTRRGFNAAASSPPSSSSSICALLLASAHLQTVTRYKAADNCNTAAS